MKPFEENTNNRGNFPRKKVRGQTFTIFKTLEKGSKSKIKMIKIILDMMGQSNMHDLYQWRKSYEFDQMLEQRSSKRKDEGNINKFLADRWW